MTSPRYFKVNQLNASTYQHFLSVSRLIDEYRTEEDISVSSSIDEFLGNSTMNPFIERGPRIMMPAIFGFETKIFTLSYCTNFMTLNFINNILKIGRFVKIK